MYAGGGVLDTPRARVIFPVVTPSLCQSCYVRARAVRADRRMCRTPAARPFGAFVRVSPPPRPAPRLGTPGERQPARVLQSFS